MRFSQRVEIAAGCVAALQGKLPPEIREIARAVPVHYEAAPDASVLREGFESDILGLFANDDPLPPQIILYINNIWDCAAGDATDFRREVRLTYLHELGHYFGWNEDEVAARGLD